MTKTNTYIPMRGTLPNRCFFGIAILQAKGIIMDAKSKEPLYSRWFKVEWEVTLNFSAN